MILYNYQKFILFLIFFLYIGNSFAEVVTSSNNNRSDISSNSVGLGLSISKKINLMSEIFVYDDMFYKKYKNNRKNPIKKDYIFAMPEIFYENFFNNNLDNHYGVGINIGYGYKKFDGFASIGLLNSNFSYKIDNQNYTENEKAFYYGLGLDYNFTKYITTRLGAKFYSLNFAHSENNQKYQLKNNSISLSLVLKL